MADFEFKTRQQIIDEMSNNLNSVNKSQFVMNEIATPGAASTKITEDMKEKSDK